MLYNVTKETMMNDSLRYVTESVSCPFHYTEG
jgi:hypothetical protein